MDKEKIISLENLNQYSEETSSKIKEKIAEHTDNTNIHVTAVDKNIWNGKFDSNQGTSNAGKLLGTNSSGDVVTIQGYGFEYNEETKMLEYGTDPTTNLNQGIGLDNTLSKKGYAAEASAVGELKSDLGNLLYLDINWTDGYYLYYNTSQGEQLIESASYSVTDYIFIPKGISLKIRTYMSAYAKLIVYDANKVKTEQYQQTSGVTYGEFIHDISATNVDRYVRFTCYQPNKSKAFIKVTNPLEEFATLPVVSELISSRTQNVIKGFGSRIGSDSTSQLSSLADATPNTVYVFTAKVEDSQPSASGTLLTLNCTSDNNGGHVQIFFDAVQNLVYTRIKWSRTGGIKFTDWIPLARQDKVLEPVFTDLSMFSKIGVIGDSFASGVIYPNPYVSGGDTNYTHYDKSWIQILGRKHGIEAVNYSVGGCTTRSWLTNHTYGKDKMLADTPCDLYFLCLGINDSNESMGDYLGIESDIESGADTFYGNYGNIVREVKAHAPNAFIVFTTYCRIPTSGTSANYDAFNTAIKNIASHYSVPCLVLTDDDYFKSDFYLNKMHNNHPTALQYVGYANAIDRLLTKSMIDNYAYFENYSSASVS